MEYEIITLFKNCKIETVDNKSSIAEVMSMYRDKILAIGTEKNVRSETRNFIENSERDVKLIEVDLRGAYIVPGFIDAHLHPIIAIYYKTQLHLSEVRSYAELGAILKKEDEIRSKDEWILGFNLMENVFTDPAERFFPDRYKLDEICTNRPLIIFRYDGHICSVNSLALNIMGIEKSTVNEITFESGEIQLDAEGNPSGIFTEGATTFALENAPTPSREMFKEASKKFFDELASYGITTCGAIIQAGELGIAGKAGRLELPFLKYLIQEGQIEQDLVIFIVTDKLKKLNQIKRSFSKLVGESDKISVDGIKLWADGSFGAFTAYMFEPFSDSIKNKTGLIVTERKKLFEIFKEAYELGYLLACHAVGDRANRMVVDVYRDILEETNENKTVKKPKRIRIEHASLIDNNTLADAAKLGIIFACQPQYINSEYMWLEKRLGPKRIKYVYPFRSIIDSGAVLAGASDAPIESPNVLEAIQACVTRNGFVPEQAINVYEALKMFTFNAAFALGKEKVKGSLETGKLADFVILERDIMSVPSDKIADIKILKTYHRGKEIFNVE